MRRKAVSPLFKVFAAVSLAACASSGGSGPARTSSPAAASTPAHQMYAGAELPAEQVAIITIRDDGGWATTVRAIDGTRPPAGARRIAVLPGKHSIVIDVVITQTGSGITSSVTGNKTIEFEAVAGRSYVLNQGNIR